MSAAELTQIDLPGLLDLISWAISDSGYTQAELAEAADLSEKHVSQMMTGRVSGSLTAWQRLMDAADVRVRAQVYRPTDVSSPPGVSNDGAP